MSSSSPIKQSLAGPMANPQATTGLESILVDIDRLNKRRKVLKKQLNENIDSVLSLLESSAEDIKNMNAMDLEVNKENSKGNLLG